MSMLTSLANQMRASAHDLRRSAPSLSAPYVVPETKEGIALAMKHAAALMEEAADTTLGLWERAYGLERENDMLRVQRDDAKRQCEEYRDKLGRVLDLLHEAERVVRP